MRVNNIPKYKSYWYEDLSGNEVTAPNYISNSVGAAADIYQHLDIVVVQSSICLLTKHRNEAWPVVFLKWLIEKMPNSWKAKKSNFRFETTICHSYDIIRYLVDKANWAFNDACVAAAHMCGRCAEIISLEADGLDDDTIIKKVITRDNIHCVYCKHIDSDHHNLYVMRRCYRDFAAGKDPSIIYKDLSRDKIHA